MVKLVDNVLAKEEEKALAMRHRFEDRTKRFLDAKQRTIGVDKDYLQKQVEEKRMEVTRRKEAEKHEALQLEQLCNFLDEREFAKQEVKQRELKDVQSTLAEQIKIPKNNAIGKADPLDLENCGPASVQRFQGEDNEYDSRKILQQRQLQEWCEKHRKEKEEELQKEVTEEEAYSQYVISEDKLRCEIHEQEQSLRSKENVDVMLENLHLAEERRARMNAEKEMEIQLEKAETKFVQTSPLFCEETNYAKSALSEKRVRPDHFKGFSLSRSKEIIDENASVVVEKKKLVEAEKRREHEWAIQQDEMIKKMVEIETERNLVIKEDNEIQANTLKLQREELKLKQEAMEKEKFGAIGRGFFQKFGKSCR